MKAIEMEKTTPAPLSVSRELNVFNIAQGPITMDARQEKQTLVSLSTTRSSLKSKIRYGIIRRWSIWPKKNECRIQPNYSSRQHISMTTRTIVLFPILRTSPARCRRWNLPSPLGSNMRDGSWVITDSRFVLLTVKKKSSSNFANTFRPGLPWSS